MRIRLMAQSRLEQAFEQYLINNNIEYQKEYKFIPNRRFRADFYLEKYRLLIEIEGGMWSNGRHNRGSGYRADCDKYNLATLHGYKLIRFCTEHIKNNDYDVLEQLLAGNINVIPKYNI